MDGAERARRYRARKRGEDVEKAKPGPKPGYKQSPEHVEKRKRWGADHHAWAGDETNEKNGRKRAQARFAADACVSCGATPAERHHVDGNPSNNAPENVTILCRRCHMAEDGRLDVVRRNPGSGSSTRH
jgi:5-methylcytosine-specific restriction endonuclease McrA